MFFEPLMTTGIEPGSDFLIPDSRLGLGLDLH